MMSAPAAATSSGNMALTVAPVPTGMKAGVRMTPRGVAMAPVARLAVPGFEREGEGRGQFALRAGLSRQASP